MSDVLQQAWLPIVLLVIVLITLGYIALQEYWRMNSTKYRRERAKKYR